VKEVDIAVIGGGPAGMAAAIEAFRSGIRNIVILERDRALGGILQQCVHNGFGLQLFKEELTGPEYAERFIRQVEELGIEVKLNTMVFDISQDKIISAVNSEDGLLKIKAKAVILAMGCRERTRGALNIPGTRPAGIYTAGTAQRFVNVEGFMPGKKIVILGSGDIGLIMARRLTLEGAEVKMVCEIMPHSGGLTRNIVQCLEDFDIPLKLRHTVVEIHGRDRVEGVTVARVDDNRKPVPGTEEFVECDTLLLSVGLIPENELTAAASADMDEKTSGPVVDDSCETSVKGIFACGNVVHVHDLVDNVTTEAYKAGKSAAAYVMEKH
jgi:thioredoxin reductase